MKAVSIIAFAVFFGWMARPGMANELDAPLSFGVISQRSAVLTAQYWNPILRYLSQRSGVPLQIKLAKTGIEHAAMIKRGEFDFLYSNHNFMPENDTVGYKVIARPLEPAIRGQIIVLSESTLRSMSELQGREVVFPSQAAFVGYHVPIDALQRAGLHIKPQFASNQEGALGQLIAGRVPAAGVNSEIARDFALRQQIGYRVLWSSEEFLSIPISVHPSVPPTKVEAVRKAMLGMAADPEGAKILKTSATLANKPPPHGFVEAQDEEYNNVRRVYKNSVTLKAAL